MNISNFLSITRRLWSPDDKLTLKLPISIRLEKIKDDRPEYASIQVIQLVSADSLSEWSTPIPAAYNDQLFDSYNNHVEEKN
ncbi:hypothetical protein NC653_009864 [Populus alba x Populus x berolinensis]|uniref:Uncharacterized protein n=1 Tax=Populus alba x Populus x berolinensis TaxID=444605 RepID=A0AAD6RAK5_9ROSI|nr:hypothetical protein NC653_009864 [Populus alba x Populus x berolinensis]